MRTLTSGLIADVLTPCDLCSGVLHWGSNNPASVSQSNRPFILRGREPNIFLSLQRKNGYMMVYANGWCPFEHPKPRSLHNARKKVAARLMKSNPNDLPPSSTDDCRRIHQRFTSYIRRFPTKPSWWLVAGKGVASEREARIASEREFSVASERESF